jgi:DNA-directed RNA polymerase subunit RPC12/RpoP
VPELYYCQQCEDANRDPVVSLSRALRCERCGSDAVVSVEALLNAQRRAVPARKPLLLIARTL